MVTLKITKNDFEEKVIQAVKPAMVDFWAHWCGPCRLAGPIIDELAKQYKDKIIMAKVNVDEEGELANRYKVMSVPTVIMFKDGKEVDRQIGFVGKEGYEEMIRKLSSS